MIPSRQEVFYRLYGALRLARFDTGGAQYFDEVPEAALRSFFAALLVAPAYFLSGMLMPDEMAARQDTSFLMLIAELLIYSLSWTVFPVVAYHICQSIDRERAFYRYLAANNWAKVVTYHLGLALFALLGSGALPPGFTALLGLAGGGYLIAYSWFIARACLNISPAGAAGFLALQIMIEFFIVSFAAVLIG
jgi:hypothetical protein